MTVSRSTPPRRRKRGGLRFLFAFTTTTVMIATGGFGAFPDNPLTQTYQEVISQNIPADFLNPFNSYMESISAPQIPPQPASTSESDSQPDPLGFFQDLFAEDISAPTPILAEAAVIETAIAAIAETQTQITTVTAGASSPTVTQALTLTQTQTFVPALTLLPTATESLTPTWTIPPVIVYPASTSTKKPPPANTPTTTLISTPSPPCSTSTGAAVNVTFVNSSPAQSVNIYWVDSTCILNLYANLGPEQSYVQGTFLLHAWRFMDASTGQLIADYVVSAADETVDVSNGMASTPMPTACIAGSNLVSIPGENWYLGQTSCSCDVVCGSQGGVNLTVFNSVGDDADGGTNIKCNDVLTLFFGPGSTTDWAPIGANVGCHLDINGNLRARYIGEPSLTSASAGNVQRVCACNN